MSRRAGVALWGLALLLAGCGGEHGDLKAFVARTRASAPAGAIEPIPTIAAYQPYAYHDNGRRTPFTPSAPAQENQPQNDGLAPDLKRPRDPLEAFPLDALHMVGTITGSGVTYALIRAPDHVIYRAARGDHLGQHFGKVRSVSAAGVVLVEIVPDGAGGYVKRAAALASPSG